MSRRGIRHFYASGRNGGTVCSSPEGTAEFPGGARPETAQD